MCRCSSSSATNTLFALHLKNVQSAIALADPVWTTYQCELLLLRLETNCQALVILLQLLLLFQQLHLLYLEIGARSLGLLEASPDNLQLTLQPLSLFLHSSELLLDPRLALHYLAMGGKLLSIICGVLLMLHEASGNMSDLGVQ